MRTLQEELKKHNLASTGGISPFGDRKNDLESLLIRDVRNSDIKTYQKMIRKSIKSHCPLFNPNEKNGQVKIVQISKHKRVEQEKTATRKVKNEQIIKDLIDILRNERLYLRDLTDKLYAKYESTKSRKQIYNFINNTLFSFRKVIPEYLFEYSFASGPWKLSSAISTDEFYNIYRDKMLEYRRKIAATDVSQSESEEKYVVSEEVSLKLLKILKKYKIPQKLQSILLNKGITNEIFYQISPTSKTRRYK